MFTLYNLFFLLFTFQKNVTLFNINQNKMFIFVYVPYLMVWNLKRFLNVEPVINVFFMP